jgi:hypothetical protein
VSRAETFGVDARLENFVRVRLLRRRAFLDPFFCLNFAKDDVRRGESAGDVERSLNDQRKRERSRAAWDKEEGGKEKKRKEERTTHGAFPFCTLDLAAHLLDRRLGADGTVLIVTNEDVFDQLSERRGVRRKEGEGQEKRERTKPHRALSMFCTPAIFRTSSGWPRALTTWTSTK